jgi:hypothetical protein
MQRRHRIPKAELVSGLALVALCAATIFQLLRIRSNVFDTDASTPHGDATVLVEDLRRTATTGLLHASALEIELRVAAAAGVVCAADERVTSVAALPAAGPDRLELDAIETIGWPDAHGRYTYTHATLQPPRTGGAACASAGIELPTGAMILDVAAPGATRARVGSAAVLFSRIAYRFRPADEPARRELWRAAGDSERRIATVSSDAAFRFYVDAARTPAAAAPAPLSRVRGIELHLPGWSGADALPGAIFLRPAT